MRTDAIFYELFRTAPQIFFELLHITPTCPYRFESVAVKSAEKRTRTMREVATYFEQRAPLQDNEWQAAILNL